MALFGGRNRKVEIDIVANDQASSTFGKVASGMNNMASKVNSGINSMNSGLQRYNNAMTTLYRSTQVAVAGAGYLLYKFTKDSVKQFAEFERQHAKTMGAIASNYDKTAEAQRRFLDDQKKLKEESLKLGTVGPTQKGSLYNPTQVSYAQTALSKAGVKPQDISSVLPQIIKFAGGNDLGLDTAADYAVNIGTMFDVPKGEWGKMLDQITRAADISTVDVPDIFESLKYAGGIAGATKRPLEEVLSMVAIMGNSGLRGSMAGTGIQAFLTRLLAPTKPMKNTLEAAPSDRVIQILSAFTKETTDANGKFKDAATVTGMLDTVMEQLNDREQAWFSKQLFGMFQMKAGFTLAKSGGDKFSDLQNDIVDNAPGTNDRKWDMMLNSSYGKQLALDNAILGIKTDVGYRLSPITNAIADELFRVLTDKDNYRIDFTKIDNSLQEASRMIGDQYGTQVGDFVHGAGNVLIRGSRVAMANEPLLEGAGVALTKLLQGDLPGAFGALKDSVGKTDDKIKELPPELQGLAKEVRNAVIALGTLATINFAARLLENLSTLWKYTIGKLIKTPTMTVTATTVIVRDTGLVDKNGKPIYRQEEVTTKETVDKNKKGGGTGGLGGGGTKSTVILDKDGKPVKTTPTPSTSTILGKDGKPISSAKPATEESKPSPTATTGSGRFGKAMSVGSKIAIGSSWAYAIGEMTGINDTLLDKMGATEGTKSRDVIDKGRTGLNYGLTASMADDFILGGAVKKGIINGSKAIGTSVAQGVKSGAIQGAIKSAPLNAAKGVVNTVKTIAEPTAGMGVGGMGAKLPGLGGMTEGMIATGTLPLIVAQAGLMVIADQYKKNKEGIANKAMVTKAVKEGRDVYWGRDGKPFVGFTEAEQQKRVNDARYNFRGTIGGQGVQIRQAEPNKWLHPFEHADWKKKQAELDAQDSKERSVWNYAKSKYQGATGQQLTWEQFSKDQEQWTKAFNDGVSTFGNHISSLSSILNNGGVKNAQPLPLFSPLIPGADKVGMGVVDTGSKLDALNQGIAGVKDGQVPISTVLQQIYGTSPTGADVNTRLDVVNGNLISLQNQKPQVFVSPPTVNVDVKVDKNGNVTQNKYIVDSNPLDSVLKQFDRRYGK